MEFTYELKNGIGLDLSGIKKLEKDIRGIQKRHIKYGWFDGKSYPASHDNAGLPIAQVANWQEYGLSRGEGKTPIPARPYFRQTNTMIWHNYKDSFKGIFTDALHGIDTTNKLNTLAAKIPFTYRMSVMKQNYPKLSDYTVALKGHTYQMFDSGVMVNSFNAKVYRTSQDNIQD